MGHNVTAFSHSPAKRELIERLEPDVSLVDIRLGEDSGIEVEALDLGRPSLRGDSGGSW